VKELKDERTNFITNRNELEEFFLECMEDVKKDINKRRDLKSAKYSHKSTHSSSQRPLSSMNKKFGQFKSSDKQ
jgi:hypothetical protein